MTKPRLRAAPNRVLIGFPERIEKKGTIFIPETSQLRPEFGEILDVGEPVGDEARACASFLLDLKAEGRRVPVSVASGISYWRESYEAEGWLSSIRVYRITEIAAGIVEHPMYEGEC